MGSTTYGALFWLLMGFEVSQIGGLPEHPHERENERSARRDTGSGAGISQATIKPPTCLCSRNLGVGRMLCSRPIPAPGRRAMEPSNSTHGTGYHLVLSTGHQYRYPSQKFQRYPLIDRQVSRQDEIPQTWRTLKTLFPKLPLEPPAVNDPADLLTLWFSPRIVFSDMFLAFEPTLRSSLPTYFLLT